MLLDRTYRLVVFRLADGLVVAEENASTTSEARNLLNFLEYIYSDEGQYSVLLSCPARVAVGVA